MKPFDIKPERVYSWALNNADPVYPVEVISVSESGTVEARIIGSPTDPVTGDPVKSEIGLEQVMYAPCEQVIGYWFGVEHTRDQWEQWDRNGGRLDEDVAADERKAREERFEQHARGQGNSPASIVFDGL